MSARLRAVALTVTTVLIGTVMPAAHAAAPEPPVLVGPASGSTSTTMDVPLSVSITDADGGPVDVRFEGRKQGATVPGGGGGSPFSLVAIPDTQNYTYNNRQGTMVQQAQWVLDTRSQLNTAMVVQLGDLVSEYPNTTQWGHTSAAFEVLDDAGMPNTVVAGNHDFNNTTGDATIYNTYFGPARYLGKQWTPSTASYGGYLGQNLFGPDPVDRGNMNNFALFTAGGRDWLVLNLEWEAPSYALDWARKVLAAYPDRIAIMVTHSFVNINGQRRTTAERPGGTPAQTWWTEFVSQQCSIRLVLNGHFHNGNLSEANRSDLNSCGQPVQQLLTDYQDRANGGDGWLRYYTFDPAANTMRATTYSPKLGVFETDADSSFVLPFDLSTPQPAPFSQIASVSASSGQTATTTWTGLEPDTVYEWRAVASDGTGSTTSPTWTVRTPASPHHVDDTFSRNVTNGWGAADAQHAWQLTSSLTSYSVNGSAGRVTVPAGSGRGGTMTGVSAADVRVQAELSMAQSATGSGTYLSLLARANGSTSYRSKLRYLSNGTLSVTVGRFTGGAETTLATATVPGVTATPGLPLAFALEASGTSPTTLRAKVWPAAAPEPAAWTVTGTDSTAALQVPGTGGLDVYVSGTAAAASVLSFDRFTMSRLGTEPPPANVRPTAVIGTPGTDGLTATFSGSGSSDPDGTITGYAWTFGDGSTGTGVAPSRTYAAAGTYSVTLTVTDDDGATHTATRTVTVTAPPTDTALARDDFGRTASNGWGSAQTGGAWTFNGGANRFSVAGGKGLQALTAPGNTADATLAAVGSASTVVRVNLSWSRTGSGGTLYGSVLPRRISSSTDYRCKVVSGANGAVAVHLTRRVNGTETALSSTTIAGITLAANTAYSVACAATPSGAATQVRAKLWRAGTAEPAAWQVSATDSTAALQAAGGIGISSYLSSSAASGVTLSVDDLVATAD